MNKFLKKIFILFVSYIFFSSTLFAFDFPINEENAYYATNFIYNDYDGPPLFRKYAYTTFTYRTFKKENGILYHFDIGSYFDFLSCYVNKEADYEKDIIKKCLSPRLIYEFQFLRYDNINKVYMLFTTNSVFQIEPIALGIERCNNKLDFVFSKSNSSYLFDKNGKADISIYNISSNYLYAGSYNSNYFLRKIDIKLPSNIIDQISFLSAIWVGYISREKKEISHENFFKRYSSGEFKESRIEKNVSLIRKFINQLSTNWAITIYEKDEISFEFNLVAISKFCNILSLQYPDRKVSIDGKPVNHIRMHFVSSNFDDKINMSIHNFYLNTKKSDLMINVEKVAYHADISDLEKKPTVITWKKRASINPEIFIKTLKWEISDDFSEIKEYRKEGENWVLQSTMKKVVESENKKTEK